MPNYQPIAQKNTNLGWWFYRGYYKGGLDWGSLKSKEDDNNKAYFKKVNDVLTKAKLPVNAPKVQGNYTPQYPTAYPGMVMGVGYQHETGATGEAKIGFYFDYTTGLPCLAGSSVKGIIRSAFPQFKALEDNCLIPDSLNKNKQKNNQNSNIKIAQARAKYIAHVLGWVEMADEVMFNSVYQLELAIFAGVDLKKTTPTAFEYNSIYKRDIFHDAFPVEAGNGILLGEDYITPHVGGAETEAEIEQKSLKEPTPIMFFKIMPNVSFRFDFKLSEQDIVIGDKTVSAKDRQYLYSQIITDFGVGAKTNVGYGQFQQIFTDYETVAANTDAGISKSIQVSKIIEPEYYKGTISPKRPPLLDAVITKSGVPNFVNVYVQENVIKRDIKLNRMSNAIEVGKVIKVSVDMNNKGEVVQVSYKEDKK